MRGLILKDYYSLRKPLKQFLFIFAGVIILSVLFSVSYERGNLAIWLGAIDNESERLPLIALIRMVIYLTLFVPTFFTENVALCSKEDRKAHFSNTVFSMPLRTSQIVGARYITFLFALLIGMATSAIAAFFISLANAEFTLKQMMSVICLISAVELVAQGIIFLFTYLIDAEKAIALFVITTVLILGTIILKTGPSQASLSEAAVLQLYQQRMEKLMNFITTKSLLIFLLGLIVLGISYLLSLIVVNKKRGNAI